MGLHHMVVPDPEQAPRLSPWMRLDSVTRVMGGLASPAVTHLASASRCAKD